MTFYKKRDIETVEEINIGSGIPYYPSFSYVALSESFTLDYENSIYSVDDLRKTFFIPSKRGN